MQLTAHNHQPLIWRETMKVTMITAAMLLVANVASAQTLEQLTDKNTKIFLTPVETHVCENPIEPITIGGVVGATAGALLAVVAIATTPSTGGGSVGLYAAVTGPVAVNTTVPAVVGTAVVGGTAGAALGYATCVN